MKKGCVATFKVRAQLVGIGKRGRAYVLGFLSFRLRHALRKAVEKQVGKEVQGLFTLAGARCDRTVTQVFQAWLTST
jgi:hypothetical protein